MHLRISYDAAPLSAGTTWLNQPGVPSYLKDVFEKNTTNHQYDLAPYPGEHLLACRRRAVEPRDHTGNAGPSWSQILNQANATTLDNLGGDGGNAADRTAYALIDDHNVTSPDPLAADLRAEAVASSDNNFAGDGDRNYRIDYIKATPWSIGYGTWVNKTINLNSGRLIGLNEFDLAAGDNVQVQVMSPPTATLDITLAKPTSGGALADTVRSATRTATAWTIISIRSKPRRAHSGRWIFRPRSAAHGH